MILRLSASLHSTTRMHFTTSVKLPPKPSQGLCTGSVWTKVWKFVIVRARSKNSSHTNLEVASHVPWELEKLLHAKGTKTQRKFTITTGTRATLLSFGMPQQKQMEPGQRKAKRTIWNFEGRKRSERAKRCQKGGKKVPKNSRDSEGNTDGGLFAVIVDMYVNIHIFSMQYTYQIPFQDCLDSIVVMHHGSKLPRRRYIYIYIHILSFCIPLAVPPENLLSHLLRGHTLQSWTTKSLWKNHKHKMPLIFIEERQKVQSLFQASVSPCFVRIVTTSVRLW